MNKMNRHSTRQHGLSLIELLIASAIGLFLVLGVVEVFNVDNLTENKPHF